jgi:hypothetical protein
MVDMNTSSIGTIHDLKQGDRVTSTVDEIDGTVTDIDYTSVAIQWDDGACSQFRKADGFVGFNPKRSCQHTRLNEDGICRSCGTDRRGI